MASNFDRWEKDPFFSAAEEVQESADRMESTYRTWIHAMNDSSSMWDCVELRRDLHTAIGTTKWQLEEFERAVKLSYLNSSVDDSRDRHRQFVDAIRDQILKIEKSLEESPGKAALPWMRLDDRESNEFALFLTGPTTTGEEIHVKQALVPLELDGEGISNCSKTSCQSIECGLVESRDEKLHGHRRVASASADIGVWKIAITGDNLQHPELLSRRVPSFLGLLKKVKSASKLAWSKQGFRKCRVSDRHEEVETELSQSQQLRRGINSCYDRSKSCLDSCDDCYDKQLYGWYGALHRQLQRSQYQMQFRLPIQVAIWVFLLLCLIVVFFLRAF